MVGANVGELIKPKGAYLVQDPPFIGNSIRHHTVERGDTVGRYDQDLVT